MCGLDKYTMPYIMTKKQYRLEAAKAVFMEQQQTQQQQQQNKQHITEDKNKDQRNQ